MCYLNSLAPKTYTPTFAKLIDPHIPPYTKACTHYGIPVRLRHWQVCVNVLEGTVRIAQNLAITCQNFGQMCLIWLNIWPKCPFNATIVMRTNAIIDCTSVDPYIMNIFCLFVVVWGLLAVYSIWIFSPISKYYFIFSVCNIVCNVNRLTSSTWTNYVLIYKELI